MLTAYSKYTGVLNLATGRYETMEEPSRAFRRSYGNCEQFFSPCHLTGHCTDGTKQDLQRLGYQQLVYDKETNETISLVERRKNLGLDCK